MKYIRSTTIMIFALFFTMSSMLQCSQDPEEFGVASSSVFALDGTTWNGNYALSCSEQNFNECTEYETICQNIERNLQLQNNASRSSNIQLSIVNVARGTLTAPNTQSATFGFSDSTDTEDWETLQIILPFPVTSDSIANYSYGRIQGLIQEPQVTLRASNRQRYLVEFVSSTEIPADTGAGTDAYTSYARWRPTTNESATNDHFISLIDFKTEILAEEILDGFFQLRYNTTHINTITCTTPLDLFFSVRLRKAGAQ